jgi:hypothetical protein
MTTTTTLLTQATSGTVTQGYGHSSGVKSVRKVYCSGCCKYFVGNEAFDMHRVGRADKGTRRCLATVEMQSCGFASEKRKVRIILAGKPLLEKHDVWFVVADRERAKRVFGKEEAA